jgi:hypothetical protein
MKLATKNLQATQKNKTNQDKKQKQKQISLNYTPHYTNTFFLIIELKQSELGPILCFL